MVNWKKSLLIGLFSSMLWEQNAVATAVGLQRADLQMSPRFDWASKSPLKGGARSDLASRTVVKELWQERYELHRQQFIPEVDADLAQGVASRLKLEQLDIVTRSADTNARQQVAVPPLLASRGGMRLPTAPESAAVGSPQDREAKQQQQAGQKTSNRAPTLQPNSGATAPLGGRAVSVAMQYQGVPYQYGGVSPQGFDCSGFIQYVYRQVGVELPRTTYAQSSAGAQVAQGQLQPGDLLIFSIGGVAMSHAGIYIGGGQFVHADADRGIAVAALSNPYWAGVYQAGVRIGG